MLGNFSYCNPTKLYFGENSLSNLSDELRKEALFLFSNNVCKSEIAIKLNVSRRTITRWLC